MAAVDAVVGSWRAGDIGNSRVERRSSHGQADLDRDNPRSLHVADLVVWVELRGFEPLTPSMRTWMSHSYGLRPIPNSRVKCQVECHSGMLHSVIRSGT